ncbi:unnamed protein product [Urochloa humidicola]
MQAYLILETDVVNVEMGLEGVFGVCGVFFGEAKYLTETQFLEMKVCYSPRSYNKLAHNSGGDSLPSGESCCCKSEEK